MNRRSLFPALLAPLALLLAPFKAFGKSNSQAVLSDSYKLSHWKHYPEDAAYSCEPSAIPVHGFDNFEIYTEDTGLAGQTRVGWKGEFYGDKHGQDFLANEKMTEEALDHWVTIIGYAARAKSEELFEAKRLAANQPLVIRRGHVL